MLGSCWWFARHQPATGLDGLLDSSDCATSKVSQAAPVLDQASEIVINKRQDETMYAAGNWAWNQPRQHMPELEPCHQVRQSGSYPTALWDCKSYGSFDQ